MATKAAEVTDPLTIAMDYDDTFTADMKFWSAFVQNANGAGHRVVCVTARRNTEENTDEINSKFNHWGCHMPIVFTELGSKLHAVEKRGLKIDIWIDDNPEALVRGH